MGHFRRQTSRFFVLIAILGLLIPPVPVHAEVHYFCTILAGKTCGGIRNRSTALLDKISIHAGTDAAALQAIKDVRSKVAADKVTGPDLVKLARALRAAAPAAAQAEIKNALGEMAVNQQVNLWLLKGVPGNVTVPTGSKVPIALVPGMPRGQIVSMGFGPALIGIDKGGSSIVLGQGNVQQVADEVSLMTNTASPAAVTLANPTETAVGYTINDQPYTMEPKFTHDVSGQSVIAFDRGGNNGTVRYSLKEGYYEFAVTSEGWQLYKRQRPTKSEATTPPKESAESSTYSQSFDTKLPKNFKLFDPVPTIAGDASDQTAQLPEHFTLFSAASDEVAAANK